MAKVDSRAAVYTGSFDPITLGHLNVIQRCSRLVDRLIVGIGVNIEKEALFSVEDRMDLVRQIKNIPYSAFYFLIILFIICHFFGTQCIFF